MRIEWFFIWTNLNPIRQGMHCATFDWNWHSGSWEDFFSFSLFAFTLFRNYLPLEKSRNLHLNKLESSSPKGALWLVWLKLVQWFLRRILNSLNEFLLFCGPFCWTNLNPLHRSQVWLKLAHWFWRRQKCENLTTTTTTITTKTTDNEYIFIKKSSLVLTARVS